MGDQQQTRHSLIIRLKDEENVRAWQEFAEIYQPLIYSLARRKGLQEADAYDLTQEVLTRVAGSIDRFDPNPSRGSFRGWLATITRNLVIEFFRKGKRLPRTGSREEIQSLLENAPAPNIETSEFDLEHKRQLFNWAAQRIRHQFEPATWQAFWMTAVESKSIAQACEVTGISKGAVYIARSRVMARLRETVQKLRFESGLWEVTE
ncbi:MAG: sigma-70 family RNA polymerase sigma factor [Planctomycetota bacterium]